MDYKGDSKISSKEARKGEKLIKVTCPPKRSRFHINYTSLNVSR